MIKIMKILIVRTFPSIMDSNKYNIQEIGLAKALTRVGHTCGIVLYNGKNKDLVEKIPVLCGAEERQIIVYRLHGFGILKNGFFPSLHKITRDYDVIQVHEYDQLTSWLYYAWSKKKIVIYHGPYYHEFNKGYNFKCKIFDAIFLRIRHNKNVICMAKSTLAAEFLRSKGFKNVNVVGVGLDLENFEAECKEEIPIDKTKKNIIYVGKIEERRNSLLLLDIMKGIHKTNPAVNCIIIGNGEKDYVDRFLQKAGKMIEEGYLQYYTNAVQSQLARLYEKADLMLFPSNYEIFGMVLLEAVYFGLPVITSKNGGADVFEENPCLGRVLQNFDLKTWVESAQEFLSISKEGNNLADMSTQKISWDAKVSNFITCYEM